MEILIKASQFFLSLSILVIFHELGHFIAARIFKTRVEKFFLFFDPWFSLFKKKIGETVYGIGWLPLGGYVKIAGMIDESLDKEQMKQPPQPWEFRSKPAWQRLIIILGGITVNVILAIVIYIFLLSLYGETYLPLSNAKYGISCDSLALEMGLKNGDKIISIDNQKVERFNDVIIEIILRPAKSVQVEREGKIIDVHIQPDVISKIISSKKANIILPRFPYIIEDFAETSIAKEKGMEKGDQIIALNGDTIPWFHEFRAHFLKFKGKEVLITVLRNDKYIDFKLTVPENGILGILVKDVFEYKTKDYSFFEAIPAGVKLAFQKTVDYIRQFKLIFTQEKAYESIGGFITIGSLFSAQWDWYHFWSFTAFLSIILAFMNLLPIPALDGGHVIFILWEMITGKKPNEKVLEYAQIAGMIIIFSLLIFANANDVIRLFK